MVDSFVIIKIRFYELLNHGEREAAHISDDVELFVIITTLLALIFRFCTLHDAWDELYCLSDAPVS